MKTQDEKLLTAVASYFPIITDALRQHIRKMDQAGRTELAWDGRQLLLIVQDWEYDREKEE